jgi:hypothetical protein
LQADEELRLDPSLGQVDDAGGGGALELKGVLQADEELVLDPALGQGDEPDEALVLDPSVGKGDKSAGVLEVNRGLLADEELGIDPSLGQGDEVAEADLAAMEAERVGVGEKKTATVAQLEAEADQFAPKESAVGEEILVGKDAEDSVGAQAPIGVADGDDKDVDERSVEAKDIVGSQGPVSAAVSGDGAGQNIVGSQEPVSAAVSGDGAGHKGEHLPDWDEGVGLAKGSVCGLGPISVAKPDSNGEHPFPSSEHLWKNHIIIATGDAPHDVTIKIDTDSEGEGLAAVVEATGKTPKSSRKESLQVPVMVAKVSQGGACSALNMPNRRGRHDTDLIEPFQYERRSHNRDKLVSILQSGLERVSSLQNEDGAVENEILAIASEFVVEVTRSFSPRARCRLLGSLLGETKLDNGGGRATLQELFEKSRELDDKLNKAGDMLQGAYIEWRRKKWGMWKSFLWATIASAFSGASLYLISSYMESTEQSEGIRWIVLNVLVPSVLFGVYSVLQQAYTEKERDLMQYTKNAVVNFRFNALSKAGFFGMKDCPWLKKPNLWARIVTFTIDVIGAFFLWLKNGYYEPDIPDT